MKKVIDARKLDCPKPILEAQKAFQDQAVREIEISVANKTARENLKRFAKSNKYSYNLEEKENDEYIFFISRGDLAEDMQVKGSQIGPESGPKPHLSQVTPASDELTYLVLSDELGRGETELGRILMKGFIYTLTETSPLPNKILLLNSAIKLSTINLETVEHLKLLEEKGVEVYSCGTCLNFYNLADQLKVGMIGNMYDVVEALTTTKNKITVG